MSHRAMLVVNSGHNYVECPCGFQAGTFSDEPGDIDRLRRLGDKHERDEADKDARCTCESLGHCEVCR